MELVKEFEVSTSSKRSFEASSKETLCLSGLDWLLNSSHSNSTVHCKPLA